MTLYTHLVFPVIYLCPRRHISYVNSHLWNWNNSLSCAKAIGFVVLRAKPKTIGIGAAECSWGDVKIINTGKIYAIRS